MDMQTRALLVKKELGHFELGFVGFGVQRLEDLSKVSDQELSALGMTPAQKNKFYEAVEESRERTLALEGMDAPNIPTRRLSLPGGDDGSSMNSTEREKKGFRHTFAGFGNILKGKKNSGFISTFDDTSSFGSADKSFSNIPRVTGSTKRTDRGELGGGYNDGGNEGGFRQQPVDRSLNLDIAISRVPQWNIDQAKTASTNSMAVLTMYRGGNAVKWNPVSSGVGATSQNRAFGSTYFHGETETICPISGASTKVQVVKGSARIRASVRQVLSILICHDTAKMMERMTALDGSFCAGQVLHLVSPRTADGKQPEYTYPSVPLCTIKRSCHDLPDSKRIREFVYRDFYELREYEGREVAVRSMVSVNVPECNASTSANISRGIIYEGSGFVISPCDGDTNVELSFVLAAQTVTGGSKIFSNPKKKQFQQLEAMVSIVDSVRVWVERKNGRYGDLSNAPDIPQPAFFGDNARGGPNVSPKAASRLMTPDESASMQSATKTSRPSRTSRSVRFADPPLKKETSVKNTERLSMLLSSMEEEVAVRKSVSRETMSREDKRKIETLEQQLENLRKELEMERKRAKEIEQRTRMSMHARDIVKQETQKMREGGATSRSQDDEIEHYRKLLQDLLPPGVSIEDLDMSLEEAEERLKGALQILLNTEDEAERMKAQQDFDRFDGIIRNHPDYKKRELEKWEKWESDNMPKNKEALETMKSIVKEEYLTKSVEEMKALGLREALAKRIKEKTVFQLFYKTPDEISKLHHVALQNYNCQGLDIVERRALYQCLPSEWVNDGDGQKARWKDNYRQKLSEVITSEENGNLRGNDLRNFAYKKDAPAAKKTGPPLNFGTRGGGPRGNPLAAALESKFAAARGPPRGNPIAAALESKFAARGPPKNPAAAALEAQFAARGPPRGPAKNPAAAALEAQFAARGPPRGPAKNPIAAALESQFAARGPPRGPAKNPAAAALEAKFAARGPPPSQQEATSAKPSPVTPPPPTAVSPAVPQTNESPKVEVAAAASGPSSENDEGKAMPARIPLKKAESKRSVPVDLDANLEKIFGTKSTSSAPITSSSSSSSSSSGVATVQERLSKGNDDSISTSSFASAMSSTSKLEDGKSTRNGSFTSAATESIKSSNSSAGRLQGNDDLARFLETSFSSEKSADKDDSKLDAIGSTDKIIPDDLQSSLNHSLHQTFEC